MQLVTSFMCIAVLMTLPLAFSAHAAAAPEKTFEANVPVLSVTEGPDPHWFGYYDKHQFDETGRYLLGMRPEFEDRPPTPEDVVHLGYVDLEDGNRWTEFATSCSWGWQQGCMLQWLEGTKVIYNTRHGDRFVSVIQDVFSGEKRVLPRPIYSVSPDGSYAVCTNFSRIAETRPGYGYDGVPDCYTDELHPDKDGLYVMDMKTGESRILFSYNEIAAFEPAKDTGGKHWFNHLLVNTDGSRFIFLHRWKKGPTEKAWGTRMFTAAPDGTGLRCVADHGMVSHFIWRNPDEILAWSTEPEGTHYHQYNDKDGSNIVLGEELFTFDGHCTYSPDGEWMLTDGYPNKERMQPLMMFRPSDKKFVELGKFYQAPGDKGPYGQLRCDLHPRWDRKGKYVCIDSMHMNNQRQMYLIDVSSITGVK